MIDEDQQQQILSQKCEAELAKCHDPVEKFKCALRKRGVHSFKTISRYFRNMDTRKDDKSDKILELDNVEFKRICRSSMETRGLTESDFENVFNVIFLHFDKDKDGRISLDEFLQGLRPPLGETRLGIVKRAFHKMDKTGDGVITTEDMEHVYNAKQHPKFLNGDMTEKQVFEKFLNTFELEEKDGRVTWNEFRLYYEFLSYSIDNDAYFNLMMTNAWKLSSQP